MLYIGIDSVSALATAFIIGGLYFWWLFAA
jgi:hypothetical protein